MSFNPRYISALCTNEAISSPPPRILLLQPADVAGEDRRGRSRAAPSSTPAATACSRSPDIPIESSGSPSSPPSPATRSNALRATVGIAGGRNRHQTLRHGNRARATPPRRRAPHPARSRPGPSRPVVSTSTSSAGDSRSCPTARPVPQDGAALDWPRDALPAVDEAGEARRSCFAGRRRGSAMCATPPTAAHLASSSSA